MRAYAYKNTEEIIAKSSSGGAFSALIDAVYEISSEAPVVIGAVWDELMRVSHQAAFTRPECERFHGSKYVQSDLHGVFEAIRDHLSENRTVLFSGTPCQIHALNCYTSKHAIPIDHLYTIDVICHGTPDPIIWLDFIRWLEKRHNDRVTYFSFRDKQKGWKGYQARATFKASGNLLDGYDVRTFTRMYFSLLVLRRRCFSCPHTSLNRPSDITLGDFWGVEQVMPHIFPGKGVSLVLVNTRKGESLASRAVQAAQRDKEHGVSMQPCDTHGFISHQSNLCKPHVMPRVYEQFWKDYTERGFDYVIRKYRFFTAANHIRFIMGKCRRMLLKR